MRTGNSVVPEGGETDDSHARALRRYLRIGTAVGGLVLLIAVALVINGVITGRRPVMFVFFGLILAELGIVFITFFRKPATRFKWIQRTCTPHPMRLRRVRDEAGQPVALLFRADGAIAEVHPDFRFGILVPDGREISDSRLETCDVFFDPEDGTPAVIETEDAVYWRRD